MKKSEQPDEQYTHLLESYKDKGLWKGSMFLLRPDDAIAFAEDLHQRNIGIIGLETWYFLKENDNTTIVEELFSPDYSDFIKCADFVERSVDAAKDYIANHLPAHISLISFVV
jgi:hypothetical protein